MCVVSLPKSTSGTWVSHFLCALVLAILTNFSNGQTIEVVSEDLKVAPILPHPGPAFHAANIREEAPHHDVKLFFPWWLNIDESSIGDGDIVVSGPNGYEQKGTFVELEWQTRVLPLPSNDALALLHSPDILPLPQKLLVATYRLFPPENDSGNWTQAENGIYAARLARGEIATESDRYLPGQFLGSFLCAIRANPGDPIQPVAVRCTVKPYRTLMDADVILESDNTPDHISPVSYRAIVYAYFSRRHLEIDWGSLTREGNVITANAKAVVYPVDTPDIAPIPLPIAKGISTLETEANEIEIDPDLNRPELIPVFRHAYDLGTLAPGEYTFILKVNDIEECADDFIVRPFPPIDLKAPEADLHVRDIKKPTADPHQLVVTYKDRSGVDVSTIGDGDIVVFGPRVFSDDSASDSSLWFAQRARLVEIVSISDHARIVKALYEIDAPADGWSEAHNGIYSVVLWEDAVCDRLRNCVDRQRIGNFEVAIENDSEPIPAEAEIHVDASHPNRVVAKVHIDFKEHWMVVEQEIRRVDNRIYLIAKAEQQNIIAIHPSPPPPQQDLLYEIGPLEDGDYGAIFIMNGHIYDAQRFTVEREPPIPAHVELNIETSDTGSVFADVTIQFFQPHRVEQGEVEINGHRVLFPAKAEPLPIPLVADSDILPLPEPIHLRYEVTSIEPGAYLGAFIMNGYPYAVEDFKIEPASPPIPAEVSLRVDVGEADNTIVYAKIEFETPHAITSRHLHRRENAFVIEVKASPIATLAEAEEDSFAPIPLPQVVWLRFNLGKLDPGEYKAGFIMNGWPYARINWIEPSDRLKSEVNIDVEELDTGEWQARVKVLFENPWAEITNPGEPIFDGHIIRIRATAEVPDVVPAVVKEPEPIELVYHLGELEPGGYWLKYFINDHFEKQHDFFVRPEGPISAKVELDVDTSEQPVIATATIQFRDHYAIIDQNIRRVGNLFLLDATAEGPLPLLAPVPPPPTEVDYNLGELPEGIYFAAFRMNGFFYDFTHFKIKEDGSFEVEVDLKVNVGDEVKVTAVVDIDDPFVIVTDPGEPIIEGNTVKIFATAERVTFIAPPSGDPVTLEYNLGSMEPGPYRLVYYVNETPEASARFFVPKPPKPPLARISHIKISEGDASWFANVGVILLPGQEVTDWGEIRREENGFHVSITVEWVDFAPSPVPLPLPDTSLLPEGVEVDANGDTRMGIAPIRIVTHDYSLGPLDPGEYKFVVHSRGLVVARKGFVVGSSAPEVTFEAENIREKTESHSFTISYTDPDGLDHESIMAAEIWLVGGLGRRVQAELVEYASTDDEPSTHGIGQYVVKGPGGEWNARDNGLYCANVDPELIRDLNGNHIERKRLGCFKVRIAPEPPQSGVNVSVGVNDLGEWEATVEIISEPGEQIVVDSWGPLIHHSHSIVALASVHIEATSGPVEPLANVYNLGTLQPGYYVFVFKTNLAHCGIATFTVPGLEGDPVDNWINRIGALPEGDNDGDGAETVGEYYFATDPNRQDVAFVRPEIVVSDEGEAHLGLRFRRVLGGEGIAQIIEGAGLSGSWDDIGDRIEIIEQTISDDGTEEILLCLQEPIRVSPYQFIRLRLEREVN